MQDLEEYTIVANVRLRGDTVISLRFDFPAMMLGIAMPLRDAILTGDKSRRLTV